MSNTVNAAVFNGSGEKGKLVSVEKVPFPEINDNQILIKSVAFAANPTDWKHSALGMAQKGAIAGSDASGVVEKVGKNVKGYESGDIVSTFMRGNYTPKRGAFSEYIIADPVTTIKYDKAGFNTTDQPSVGTQPTGLIRSFEGAASVTLGLATVGLSFSHYLKLNPAKETNKGSAILIWGGATATGFLAIQVAKLIYGLKVVTTASSKHHALLKQIGADATFDYKDKDVVEQIRKYAGSSLKYALDTVSVPETYQQTYDATSGAEEVYLDNLLFLGPENIKTDSSRKVHYGKTLAYVVVGEDIYYGGVLVKTSPELVKDYSHFWYELLPQIVPKLVHTKLTFLGNGLQNANHALELLQDEKVTGEKLVFRG